MPVRREDAHRRFPNLSFKYNLMKQAPNGFNPWESMIDKDLSVESVNRI